MQLYKGYYYMSPGILHKTIVSKHNSFISDCILVSFMFYCQLFWNLGYTRHMFTQLWLWFSRNIPLLQTHTHTHTHTLTQKRLSAFLLRSADPESAREIWVKAHERGSAAVVKWLVGRVGEVFSIVCLWAVMHVWTQVYGRVFLLAQINSKCINYG